MVVFLPCKGKSFNSMSFGVMGHKFAMVRSPACTIGNLNGGSDTRGYVDGEGALPYYFFTLNPIKSLSI